MTIKNRNRLMRVFFIFSLIVTATLLTCFIVALITHAIVPPTSIRVPAFLRKIPFTTYSFPATMVSIGILVLYVPATMFLLLRYFENTQSSEVIFFSGMLIGVLCEGARFLIPLFGLGLSFSQLLFLAGRIMLIGRLAVPLSLFGAALLSETAQRQDIERNFLIMLALSIIFASGMPLNSAQITTTCAITTGFSTIFCIIRVLIFIITAISFWMNALKHDSIELKRMTGYYVVLMAGYMFLLLADSIAFMSIGTLIFAFGTLQFLRNLHRLYKWK